MKMLTHLLSIAALTSMIFVSSSAWGSTHPLSYQGRLTVEGEPANGVFDFVFTLYDEETNPIGEPITIPGEPVSDGLFNVSLDFGEQHFDGGIRKLQISVRGEGDSIFSPLVPMQELTASPYAMSAGSVRSGGLAPGDYDSPLSFNNPDNEFKGRFVGTKTNIFSGPITLSTTNYTRDQAHAALYIYQPDHAGPHPLVMEGAWRTPAKRYKYRTAFSAGNPAMWSNGWITLDGGIGSPNFHNSYMLGIYSDVRACVELVNPSAQTNAFLIEASGPLQGYPRHPVVFAVTSRGQLTLSNPYGDNHPNPQLVITDAVTEENPTYNVRSKRGVLTIGPYDPNTGNESPTLAVKGGNVGIGTTDPQSTLHVAGSLHAPVNTAPYSMTEGEGLVISNPNNRSQIVLQIAFDLRPNGVPSCSIVSTGANGSDSFTASPLPAGLGLTTSITNIYTLPIQPGATIEIDDTSRGASRIRVLDYKLFGQ